MAEGYKYFTKTIHPKIGEYRNNSDKWKPTPHNGKYRNDILTHVDKKYSGSKARASYCHEYIGEPTYGCGDIIEKIDVLRDRIRNKNQLTLF